jgi:hypothetical protein
VVPILGGVVVTLGKLTIDVPVAPEGGRARARTKGTIVPVTAALKITIPPLPIKAHELKAVLVWQRGFHRRQRVRLARQDAERRARRTTAATVIQRFARERIARKVYGCMICLDTFPFQALVKLAPCRKHAVCVPCARCYVDSQLLDGRLHVPCPGAGCAKLLSTQARSAFGSAGALVRHHHRLAARHADRLGHETDNTFIAFCRGGAVRRCPLCAVLIWRCDGCDLIQCACGHRFEWHAPEARIDGLRPIWRWAPSGLCLRR